MDTSIATPQVHGRNVLGIWAHSDDEAYLSAGLMARTINTGGRVACVHATLGEHGTDDPRRWPPDVLGPHRANELRAALGALGVAESTILGYPDGGCDRFDDQVAITALEAVIDRVRPDVIVTFGPDEITGHRDPSLSGAGRPPRGRTPGTHSCSMRPRRNRSWPAIEVGSFGDCHTI